MFNEEQRPKQPIRLGMIGGGRGSEIGYAHRTGAERDGFFKLVAGAFDLDPQRGQSFGSNLRLDVTRCYPDYLTLLKQEAQRPYGDGIQALIVATPNATHYSISKAALEAGLHVICEKPLTFTVAQAQELQILATQKQRLFAVMYGYSGYPMLHQAREMIQRGDLGTIRMVHAQFAHGFHSQAIEEHSAGAKWRMNPEVAGSTYVLGDLGTHSFHMMELLTGLEVNELSCMRQSFVPTRAPLEDNAHVWFKFKGGAIGTLWASSVNAGSVHQQKIRVVGDKASIEWWDEHPNQLHYEIQGQPVQILDRGMAYLYRDNPAICTRIGGGHAEGFLDAWANLYHRYGVAIQALEQHDHTTLSNLWYPDIRAGISGVRLLECCVESAQHHSSWVKFNLNAYQ